VEIWDRISASATDPRAVSALTEELEVVEHVERVVFCVRTMLSFLQEYELPSVYRLVAMCGLYMHIEDREVRAYIRDVVTSMLASVREEADALGQAMIALQRARVDLLRAQAERELAIERLALARAKAVRSQASRIYEQSKRDTAAVCAVA
jgi:hypothetical protein